MDEPGRWAQAFERRGSQRDSLFSPLAPRFSLSISRYLMVCEVITHFFLRLMDVAQERMESSNFFAPRDGEASERRLSLSTQQDRGESYHVLR